MRFHNKAGKFLTAELLAPQNDFAPRSKWISFNSAEASSSERSK